MKILLQYFIVSLLLLLLTLSHCSQQANLEITIDESCLAPIDPPLTLYIINPKALTSIAEIVTKSKIYYHQEATQLRDNLSELQNKYAQKEAQLNQLQRKYSAQQDSLQKVYREKIQVKLLDFNKFGKVWQFYTRFSNYGFDKIDAITLQIKFNHDLLVKNKTIPINLLPEEVKLYPELYIDISSNPGLHFKMSQCCTDREDFLAQLQVEFEHVTSNFEHSLKTIREQIGWLKNELLALEIAIDTFPKKLTSQLQSRIYSPTNQIILQKLAAKAIVVDSVDTSGTLTYLDIKAGEYFVVLFNHTESEYQWYQDISLDKGQTELLFTAKNKKYFFLNSENVSPLLPEEKE